MALASSGAVWAWGTFRDASGVYGFSPTDRIALLPTLVHAPASAAERVVKVASGAHAAHAPPARLPSELPFWPVLSKIAIHQLARCACPEYMLAKATYSMLKRCSVLRY